MIRGCILIFIAGVFVATEAQEGPSPDTLRSCEQTCAEAGHLHQQGASMPPVDSALLRELEQSITNAPVEKRRVRPFDLLLNAEAGALFSKFETSSQLFHARGHGDFTAAIGLRIPFVNDHVQAGLDAALLRVRHELRDTLHTSSGSYIARRFEEDQSYVALPVSLAARVTIKRVTHYLCGTITPAYLTGASLLETTETHAVFSDGAVYDLSESSDSSTLSLRERHQIFAGGTLGIEVNYGYGYIFLQAGFNTALLETGFGLWSPRSTKKLFNDPGRLFLIPVTIGVRFYL